jgi:hypothetical protein
MVSVTAVSAFIGVILIIIVVLSAAWSALI